jgi:hypothetical protein
MFGHHFPSQSIRRRVLRVLGTATAAAAFLAVLVLAETRPSETRKPTKQQIAAIAAIPLTFEKNLGQVDKRASYLSHMSNYTLFLAGSDSILTHSGKAKDTSSALKMRWLGASDSVTPQGDAEVRGKTNYLIGNDRSQWHSTVPNYERVKEDALYPGVDLVYYGNDRQLEYDLTVAPGADPGAIKLEIDGAKKLRIDKASGDLVVLDQLGSELRFRKPVVYQQAGGQREVVAGSYHQSARNTVSFALGAYDHAKPLVIDPTLIYSTFIGGTGGADGLEGAYTLALPMYVDSQGYIYVAGSVSDQAYPTSSTAYQSVNPNGTSYQFNVFVSKFDPTGTILEFSTFLGGTPETGDNIYTASYAYGLAVDSTGNVYVCGKTNQRDFPLVNEIPQTLFSEQGSGTTSAGFVSKLDPTGANLLYSTYMASDGGYNGLGVNVTGIAVDNSNDAYITGSAGTLGKYGQAGQGLPITANAYLKTSSIGSGYDLYAAYGFVSEINTGSSGLPALLYSSFLAGTYGSNPLGITLGANGLVYVAGTTSSQDFPLLNGLPPINFFVNTLNLTHGFVSTLDLTKSGSASLVYSTLLGGLSNDGDDFIYAFAVDKNYAIYLAGVTSSPDFPLANAFQSATNSSNPGFLTKIDPSGISLDYSTFMTFQPISMAVDSAESVFLGGSACGSCTPLISPINPMFEYGDQSNFLGDSSSVIEFNASGSALLYADDISTTNLSFRSMAVSATDNLYIAAIGGSAAYPPWIVNPYQNGAGDYVLMRLTPLGLTTNSLAFGSIPANTTSQLTVNVANTGNFDIDISKIVEAGSGFSQINNCGSVIPANTADATTANTCTITVTFAPTEAQGYTGTVTLTDSDAGSPQVITLNGTGTAATAVSTTTTLQSSLNPSTSGQSVTFTATVTAASGTATPTGTVQFSVDGSAAGSAVTVNSSGIATYTNSALTVATHSITAVYTPTTGSVFTTSSATALSQVVNAAPVPTFTVASSTPAQSVQPGGTATYSINVTSQNGSFNSPVTLSVSSGLPTGATVSFSPNPVMPGSAGVTSTLIVQTSNSTTTVVDARGSGWKLATPALALIGLFFVPGKRRRRWITMGILLIASLGALTALSGCGGGFALPGSAAQSYIITVAGDSGAEHQTTTVQLTVQ